MDDRKTQRLCMAMLVGSIVFLAAALLIVAA
jgi:hypothetical protein